MKKLFITLTMLLSGCSIVDSYFMAHYDTNEYSLINDIRSKSFIVQKDCKDFNKMVVNVHEIYEMSYRFQGFTMYIPKNEEATKMSEKLLSLVEGTRDYYYNNTNVSELFCKSKLKQINKSAEEIQAVLARKPK